MRWDFKHIAPTSTSMQVLQWLVESDFILNPYGFDAQEYPF